MENKDNNIVVNARPNTILLQSTEDEVTGGYYDGTGEWHEFGGGGEINNPVATIKIINNSGGGFPFCTVQFNEGLIVFEDAGIQSNVTEKTVTTKVPYFQSPSEEAEAFYAIPLSMFTVANYTISEEVNCEEDEGYVFLTDPTMASSFTITVSQL